MRAICSPKAPDQVRVVALDPGVRNFITWFSEDGCGKLGEQDFGRIQRLCQHQDNLLSRATQAPSKEDGATCAGPPKE